MEVDSCSVRLRQMHIGSVSARKKIITRKKTFLFAIGIFSRIFRNRVSVLKIVLYAGKLELVLI